MYHTPIIDEIAPLIVGDFDRAESKRDTVVEKSSGELKILHEIIL